MMHKIAVNGVELEYASAGSGEAILLVGTGPLADSFAPLAADPRLTSRYRVIRYRQRGQVDGGRAGPAPAFAEHAADAAALMDALGIARAHLAGHSTGACIALQLALDHAERVQTLTLLEPPLLAAPGAAAFFEKAQPALELFAAGDPAAAMETFLSVVSGLDADTCRTLLEYRVQGAMARAVAHADVFFAGYLPALQAWTFGATEAARLTQPMLSVCGTRTEPLFTDSDALLRAWCQHAESCVVEGVGHLLHLERTEGVVQALEGFVERHPMGGVAGHDPGCGCTPGGLHPGHLAAVRDGPHFGA